MRTRIRKLFGLFALATLIGTSACSRGSLPGIPPAPTNTNVNSGVNSSDSATTTPPVAGSDESTTTPDAAPIRNSLSPIEILKSIAGAWSSTCRDLHAKVSNSSEKDVVVLNLDEVRGNTITLHTLNFSGSRSCDRKNFKDLDTFNFNLGEEGDGQQERRNALALDLLDKTVKIENPKNVLLVFANPNNSTQKSRMLFEILDAQRTSIRLQIEEWMNLLPEKMRDQEAVLLQLESVVNNSTNFTSKSAAYTKAQAFSRSSAEDLEIVQNGR